MDDDEDHLNIALGLGDQLLASSIPQALTVLLIKLDQKREEERETGFKILGIFENIFEIKPEAVNIAAQQTGLSLWLLNEISPEAGVIYSLDNFNDNKLYCSEILSIVMQNKQNQDHIHNLGKLPQVIGYLRTLLDHEKYPADFKETILNLFNCLTLILMNSNAREDFADNEGIDIMLKLLK